MPKKSKNPSQLVLTDGYYWAKEHCDSEWKVLELVGTQWWIMGWDQPVGTPAKIGDKIERKG